jgi:aldehyde:ferredoxin oxidoreductase
MALPANKEYMLIDLTRRQCESLEIPSNVLQDYPRGTALATFLLSLHQPAGINSLEPESVIVMSPGLLAGTPFPGAATCGLAGKSPLTGFWTGGAMAGEFAGALARCGWHALVIKGRAPGWSYLLLDEGKVFFRDATRILGLSLRRIREELKDAWGSAAAVLGIGLAGEVLVRFSCLSDGSPEHGVRGGLGAVFGSKNLKAVVVRPNGGVQVEKPSEFIGRIETTVKSLGAPENTTGSLALLRKLEQEEALPTHNFQALNSTENWVNDLERLDFKKQACIGCPIACHRTVLFEPDGRDGHPHMDLPLVPEHLWALGPLLGLYSVPDTCLALRNCLDLGLDPVSFGGVAAWACECVEKGISLGLEFGEILGFGNSSCLCGLAQEIVNNPEKREVLGLGAKAAAEKVGGAARAFAVHFQGQELSYADPRRRFYPLSRLGPSLDLTTVADSMDAVSDNKEWAGRLIRLEDRWSLWQVLGICPRAAKPQGNLLQEFPACLGLVGGPEVSAETLKDWGKKLLTLIKEFDYQEGWRPQEQFLGERFFLEDLQGSKILYPAVNRENWYEGYREYFALRGWADENEREPVEG